MGYGITGTKLLDGVAFTNGQTRYTPSLRYSSSSGINAVLVTVTGKVTITQQCSDDDTNWYDPKDLDGNARGEVCTDLTENRYIQFSPVLCKYIRFKVVAGAASTVTFKFFFQEAR